MPDNKQAFIDQYAPIAIKIEKETGVPASLMLAQAAHESRYGESGLTSKGNNFFGMKGSGTGGRGKYQTWEQDQKTGRKYQIMDDFAHYTTPEDSFRAYADLISRKPEYAEVMEAGKTGDMEQIAAAIDKSPYATDLAYKDRIMEVMNRHKLADINSKNYNIDENGKLVKAVSSLSPELTTASALPQKNASPASSSSFLTPSLPQALSVSQPSALPTTPENLEIPQEKNIFQRINSFFAPPAQADGGPPAQPTASPEATVSATPTPHPLSQGNRPYRTPEGGLVKTQGYGSNPQWYGGTGLTAGHEGFDYRMDKNTPVYSPVDAEVVYVGSVDNPRFANTYGNFVVMKTPNNEAYQMAHFNNIDVKPGQVIKAGDQIGKSGASGARFKGKEQPHLHIGYSKDANKVMDNIQTFEQTGKHKYPNGGFDNPEAVLTNEQTRYLVEPRIFAPKAPEQQPTASSPSVSPQKTPIPVPTPKPIGPNRGLPGVQPTPKLPNTQSRNAAAPPVQSNNRMVNTTESMRNPIQFSASPTGALQMPNKLQLASQKTPQTNIPTPSFDVGSRPQTQVSASQPFSPGVSEQVGRVTKTFSDVIKQAFKTPETPEQQQRQQSQTQTQQPQIQNASQYPTVQTALKANAQAKQKQALGPVQGPQQKPMGQMGGQIGAATAPKASATSGVRMASVQTKSASPSTYTVKKGDTLSQIAKKTTGSASNWKSLGYKGDPRKLPVGTKLSIPRPR